LDYDGNNLGKTEYTSPSNIPSQPIIVVSVTRVIIVVSLTRVIIVIMVIVSSIGVIAPSNVPKQPPPTTENIYWGY
jgi:hypothetical protein